ncbi:hypothetical protein RHSP_41510 (plasmid) [Rhizobium freirei PRF 81]|uniref:Stress-response A/B barrel domain-containing protein n=1 Tax=Rhizobium freirei PRF 81 TaxID=363754 RepID=N6USR3_9HYPH|nr:Dabb family protein [Rhizobium freirei]ENN83851.1 hypothetical protein RHSP_41510 [Rhizobium freirei PRF 81]
MIRHTIVFSLRHAFESAEEAEFLQQAIVLADIPSVRSFERLRQISPKCGFMFGFSMEFENEAGYAEYNSDPRHKAFVRDYWETGVSSFQEIDYEPLVAYSQ